MKQLFAFAFIICFTGFAANAQCCDYSYQQQFEPPTSAATFGVALGDLDNDGDRDAVAISAYFGVDVYFNNGSGTFTLNAQYATGSNGDFYGVHVVNVDGDNDLDIIAIPFYSSANLTILFNNGAGLFTQSTVSSNIACYNAAVGDIDQDGDIDIFLPNAGGGSGKIYKNNGLGTFTLHQTLSGARGHDAELGDLDGDGDLDAFVVENSSYGNCVFLNNGSGTFTLSGTTFSSNGSNVDLGDLDKDGDLDAWVGRSNNVSEIYQNNGSGSFSLHSVITNGSYCKAVNLYDYNGDNFLDVFLGFYSSAPQIWKNNGDMSFSLCYQAPVGSSSHGQTLGFINNDNAIDIYSGYFSNDDGDYVFLNVSPSIDYAGSPYCPNEYSAQTVALSGVGGGSWSSIPSGLSIDTANGSIIPALSAPGTYVVYYHIPGCSVKDSITIKSLDVGTSNLGRTITANQDSATYKWIDCNFGYTVIPGLIGRSFTASVTGGSFAVIVTYKGCSDTSLCVTIPNTTGLEQSSTLQLSIFPNPAGNSLYLHIPEAFIPGSFQISDAFGRIVLSGDLVDPELEFDIAFMKPGYYILSTDKGIRARFIKR
jgi:hypothetical protein